MLLPVSARGDLTEQVEQGRAWLPATAAPAQSSLATSALNSPTAEYEKLTHHYFCVLSNALVDENIIYTGWPNKIGLIHSCIITELYWTRF